MTEPPTLITANLCSVEENFSIYLFISFSDPIALNNFKIVSLMTKFGDSFIELCFCSAEVLPLIDQSLQIHLIDVR